jgi:RNA recognition motif-containing protein
MQALAALIKPSLGWQATAAAAGVVPALHRLFSTATKRLYVGNLPFDAKAEQVAKHFGLHGSVQDVVIPLDHLGRSRGYAFVEMDADGAEAVQGKLDRSDFMGRTIFVNEAHPRNDREGGDSSGRRRGFSRRRQQQQQEEY